MIQIIIYKRAGVTVGFNMEGHAGYAQSGHDIVCAAVSVLSINTINAIETFTKDLETGVVTSDEASAQLTLMLHKTPSHDVQLLLATYVLGIQSIVDDYNNEYISLKFEEV